jgi:membrane-associated phospholipid phosphatase
MSKKKQMNAVTEFDMKVTDALGEYTQALPFRAWSSFAKLGDQPELRVISGGILAAGLVSGSGRLFRAGLRMLLAHEVATTAKDLVKNKVVRTRPRSAASARDARPRKGRNTAKEHSSFPSGHSAGAFAVAQAFAREFPEHRAGALTAASAIAIGQIPKNAHYPTDVAAGSLLGVATEAAVAALWSSADRHLGQAA